MKGGLPRGVFVPALYVPAKDCWSFMVYSGQHRSMLQTDQQFPGIDSKKKDLQKSDDGSITVYFGPTLPKGATKENWLPTDPKRRFFLLARFYGPRPEIVNGSFVLNDIERLD